MKYISYQVQWNQLHSKTGKVVAGHGDIVRVYARDITSGMAKALKAARGPRREITRIEFWEVH